MVKMQICVSVAVVGFFSMFSMGESLQCWTCSTHDDNSCGDPFNETATRLNPWNHEQRIHNLDTCGSQSSSGGFLRSQKAVCQKRVTIVSNKRTIDRGCRYLSAETAVGVCPQTSSGEHIKLEFCETCDTDGCNAAPASVTLHAAVQVAALLPALLAAKLALF